MSFVNESNWERLVRIALGGVLLVVGWTDVVTGGWGVFLRIFGFVPLLTGLVGWCPLYALFGFSTRTRVPAA